MRVAITGSGGMLGRRLMEEAAARGHEVHGLDLPDFDLTRSAEAGAAVLRLAPDLVIHGGAMTDVDGCESAEAMALAINGEGSGAVARAVAEAGARCVYVSTDYVFGGDKASPYLEDDPTGPATAYGRSKLMGETQVLAAGGSVLRLSWSFGPDGNNFVSTIGGLLHEGRTLKVVDDQIGAPTYTRDSSKAILDIGETGGVGVFHCSNAGETTWFGFARAIAEGLGLPLERVTPCTSEEYPRPAPRPANSRLGGSRLTELRGAALPPWEDALRRYLDELDWLAI